MFGIFLVILFRQFGLLSGHLVHFNNFWCVLPRKIWQSCAEPLICANENMYYGLQPAINTQHQKTISEKSHHRINKLTAAPGLWAL
jgi:hypothetical protein